MLIAGNNDTSPISIVYRLFLSSGGILTQLGDIYTALAEGAAVPIFSDNQKPSITDAASVALKYQKWLIERGSDKDSEQTRVVILPATLVSTDQFNYQSSIIIEFGSPILITEAYLNDESMNNLEVLQRSIASAQVEAAINAPDQEMLFAMHAARDLLWDRVNAINLDEFVSVSQMLVDLLSNSVPLNIQKTKQILLEYYVMLQLTHLTDPIISSLPIPWALDPDVSGSPIQRILALLALSTSTILSLIHVPPYCLSLVMQPSSFILTAVGSWLIGKPVPDRLRRRWYFLTMAYLILFCLPVIFHVWSLEVPITASDFRVRRLVAAWALLLGEWALHQIDPYIEVLVQQAAQAFFKLSRMDRRMFDLLDTPQFEGVSFEVGQLPVLRLVQLTVQSRMRAMLALNDFFEELEMLGGRATLGASAHLSHTFGNSDGQRTVDEMLKFLHWKGLNIPASYSMD
ncbi:uncharacterized protein ARMOST_18695 [Armillaria ostoyae]|uniref:Uncharacterized protein n=1 Tax=Armillaria ostoyae TaxID=47428 RepID=A0A284S2K7_ARMOS|nr:uncharacterized protein ARMOST_18695 [Armillaria ostoyae]